MAEPTLSFIYNTSNTDSSYLGSGGDWGSWKAMHINVGTPDQFIFTGGGINASLPTPTAPYGSREATMRPTAGTLIVPQLFIESFTDNIMRHVPLAGQNTNRYVMGVYVDGYVASDLYQEAWDDNSFSSTDLSTLSGTSGYSYSMFNSVRTTEGAASAGWTGATYSGTGRSAYLAGYDYRVKLKGSDVVQDEPVYYNIYVRLPSDAPLFHDQPIIAFRYLYV